MKYILKPLLERIALVKIVVTLWNQNDVRSSLALLTDASLPHSVFELDTGWNNIENTVIEKVLLLSLSEKLKEKVVCFIKPIGLEILKWVKYHSTGDLLPIDLPYELYWNYLNGTIDKKKTTEILIKDENLDIYKRYKLACLYCFEDHILKLWNKLPEYLKIRLQFTNYFANYSATCQQYIFNYWTKFMQGAYDASFSYKAAFQFCAEYGEKEAAEYFLRKLIPGERKESLVPTAKTLHNADVLCFLFLKMDEEEQTEILKSKPYEVLRCFVDWPLQNFFTEVANQTWDFLSKDNFHRLLHAIYFKVRNGYKDCNYELLFTKFWQESPNAFKSYILDSGYFLTDVFHDGGTQNLKLFLQNASLIEKKRIFYCDQGQSFCAHLISEGKWDLLGVFIQECLASEEERTVFIKECEKRIINCIWEDNFIRMKHNLDELFPFSEDSVGELNRREYMEANESYPSRIFLVNVLRDGGRQNLISFLQNMSPTEKKKLFNSVQGLGFCAYLMSERKWDLLGVFLQECLTSKDEIMVFIKECEKNIVNCIWEDNFLILKHNLEELFPFPDDSVCELDK